MGKTKFILLALCGVALVSGLEAQTSTSGLARDRDSGEAIKLNNKSDLLIDEALKYIGTPYKWGGNDLRRGIDTSHFVKAIFSKVGLKCPSPPVINMETHGSIVDKGKSFEGTPMRGSKKVDLSNVPSDFAALRRGDILIFQYSPKGRNQTMRQCAIYAGAMKFRGKDYRHAFVHAKGSTGVTVDDMATTYRFIYAYAIRLQQD